MGTVDFKVATFKQLGQLFGVDVGTAGQVLTSNGPNLEPSFQAGGGGGAPAAPDTSVQFNDAGAFGGAAPVLFDKVSGLLSASKALQLSGFQNFDADSETAVLFSKQTITDNLDASTAYFAALAIYQTENTAADNGTAYSALDATMQSAGPSAVAAIVGAHLDALHFGSGAAQLVIGADIRAQLTNGSVTDRIVAVEASTNNDAATVPLQAGLHVEMHAGAASTVTDLDGIKIDAPTAAGGATVTNAIGLAMGDWTVAGAVANFAVNINGRFLVGPDGQSLTVGPPESTLDPFIQSWTAPQTALVTLRGNGGAAFGVEGQNDTGGGTAIAAVFISAGPDSVSEGINSAAIGRGGGAGSLAIGITAKVYSHTDTLETGEGIRIDTPNLFGGGAINHYSGLKFRNQTVAGALTNFAINVNDRLFVSAEGNELVVGNGNDSHSGVIRSILADSLDPNFSLENTNALAGNHADIGINNAGAVLFNWFDGAFRLTLGSDGNSTLTGGLNATFFQPFSGGAGVYKSADGSNGITTAITTALLVGKTITVKDGIIVGFA